MRNDLRSSRVRRRMTLCLAMFVATSTVWFPQTASAGLLDFLFGNHESETSPPPQTSPYADPNASGMPVLPTPPAPASAGGSGKFTAYCVRSCDGRYFPLTVRGGTTPAQMCQSFCPASTTKVFSGSTIDNAVAANGERYPDSANAYAYRKALRADCTCNGRDPAGLSPVDLSLDPTLRPGDVVATSNGLVAYSGTRTATGQTAEFTPVASYPGLTNEVRARLGEMKVAPVTAEVSEDYYLSSPEPLRNPPPAYTGSLKASASAAPRADLN